jgi:uncharacterized protein (DUF433 family)
VSRQRENLIITETARKLSTDAYGAIRVSGTRVLLDVIIVAFQAGATPEDIAQQFPSVALPDVYLVIAHYLTHTAEIDAYLSQRRTEAARLQCAIETRFNPVGIRARLLARQRGAR